MYRSSMNNQVVKGCSFLIGKVYNIEIFFTSQPA